MTAIDAAVTAVTSYVDGKRRQSEAGPVIWTSANPREASGGSRATPASNPFRPASSGYRYFYWYANGNTTYIPPGSTFKVRSADGRVPICTGAVRTGNGKVGPVSYGYCRAYFGVDRAYRAEIGVNLSTQTYARIF